MQEYITTTGKTIRTGQRYHDRRTTNRRELLIEHIDEPLNQSRPDECRVYYTVVKVDGKPVKKRANDTTARRLTGRDFVLIEGGAS